MRLVWGNTWLQALRGAMFGSGGKGLHICLPCESHQLSGRRASKDWLSEQSLISQPYLSTFFTVVRPGNGLYLFPGDNQPLSSGGTHAKLVQDQLTGERPLYQLTVRGTEQDSWNQAQALPAGPSLSHRQALHRPSPGPCHLRTYNRFTLET